MLSVGVTDMGAAKEFYVDKLGLQVKSDYRQDDNNWWVSLTPPEGGVTITLTTNYENLMKPGTLKVYFTASSVEASHKELSEKGARPEEIKTDLFGPGSGVKWFSVADPDGNQLLIAQV